MYREALVESEKYLALTPSNPMALASAAHAHARLGEKSQALRLLDELRALSKQRYVSSYAFALVYAGLGEKDQTFAWLEKAYEERSGALAYLKVNPHLGSAARRSAVRGARGKSFRAKGRIVAVNPKNIFAELKRRNVYKVAIAYAVVAWLLMKVASQIFPFVEIPNWAVRLVVLLLIIGFSVALILA
jgi:tetratricopeptide (TPR) repeat protein